MHLGTPTFLIKWHLRLKNTLGKLMKGNPASGIICGSSGSGAAFS